MSPRHGLGNVNRSPPGVTSLSRWTTARILMNPGVPATTLHKPPGSWPKEYTPFSSHTTRCFICHFSSASRSRQGSRARLVFVGFYAAGKSEVKRFELHVSSCAGHHILLRRSEGVFLHDHAFSRDLNLVFTRQHLFEGILAILVRGRVLRFLFPFLFIKATVAYSIASPGSR